MNSRRFNWLVLLIGGVLCLAVGALGVVASDPVGATPWLSIGIALLIGALVLRRMRLP